MILDLKTKKSESRLLTPFLFGILLIIGVGIVIGVLTFYSTQADIKIDEAKMLVNHISDGLDNNGYMDPEVLKKDSDIFTISGLDKSFFDQGGNYYFNVSIYNNNVLVKEFIEGSRDFEVQCRLKGKYFAKCFYKKVYVMDQKNNSMFYRVEILAGSNQEGGKL